MRYMRIAFVVTLAALFTSELSATDAKKYIQEGVKLHDAGDYEGAITAFKAALESDPSNPEALYELANTYSIKGDYESCIDTAQAGLVEAPSNLGAILHMAAGSCYSASGKPKKALRHFQAGLEIDPNHPMLNFNIAITLAGIGDHPAAIGHLETAIKSRPMYASPYFVLGEIYRKAGARVKSLFYYTRFVTIEPNSMRTAHASAAAYSLLSSGIEVKAGGDVTVTVPSLEDDDPMSEFELFLSLAGASKHVEEEESSSTSEADKQVSALSTFVQIVLEAFESDEARLRGDATWSQAVAPVLEIHRRGAFETLAYVMAMRADIDGGRSWIEANPEKVASLSKLLEERATQE